MKDVTIIGAGQIGYASAMAFRDAGWNVQLLARTRPSWIPSDIPFETHVLGEDPAPTADVVLDTIPYDEVDVARFDPDAIGRYIAVSSAAVYCDDRGRSFETPDLGFPEFAEPVTEDQRRLAPGPETYSTRKVRMEDKAMAMFGGRATLLRPSAIYGPHCRQPREWWFVKRLLDGRREVPLSFGGVSQFHTTCANTIASLALHTAEQDLGGAFNIADDNALTVAEIGVSVAEQMGAEVTFVPFDGPPKGTLGRTPWSISEPFVVNCQKAVGTGWVGSAPYPGQNNDAVAWLRDLNPEDWQTAFPVLASYGYDLFDYEAEDRFFDERA